MSARTTSLVVIAVAFLGGVTSLTACAGSEEPPADEPVAVPDAGAPKDASSTDANRPATDSSAPVDAAAKDTCAPSCTTDDACKNSCTVPSTGSYCCDKAISKCYKYTATVCPGPVEPPPDAAPPPTSP